MASGSDVVLAARLAGLDPLRVVEVTHSTAGSNDVHKVSE
jgi:hypothetical protein